MRYLLILLGLVWGAVASAQKDLLTSIQHGKYDYIFKLDNEQARNLYLDENPIKFDFNYLQELVDSVPHREELAYNLAPGHYLKVEIIDNDLHFGISSPQYFQANLLNNHRDFCLQLMDSTGQIIPDASVKINQKKIRFDTKSQTYRIRKANRKGLLTINVNGIDYFYEVERSYNRSVLNRLGGGYVKYGAIKYIWRPIKFVVLAPIEAVQSLIRGYPTYNTRRIGSFFERIYWKVACFFDPKNCYEELGYRQRNYQGYLATNKPMYRPGDTLFWKAYIVDDKKGKPLNKGINVYLRQPYQIKWSQIDQEAQWAGSYQGFIVLHDSLDLKLDQRLRLELSYKGSQLLNSYINYEDYELKKSQLSIRTSSEDHYGKDSLSLFVKGTDDNELPLLDGRLEIFAKLQSVATYLRDSVYVPDTLFYLERDLDPKEETEIKIPGTNFPLANLSYQIRVKLRTTDNEVKTEQRSLKYYAHRLNIDYALEGNQIQFTAQRNGKDTNLLQELRLWDAFDQKIEERSISLPYKMDLNPYIAAYELQGAGERHYFKLDQAEAGLTVQSSRVGDSLKIQISNPHQVAFNYFLYDVNREIARGFATELELERLVKEHKNAYLSLQYLWAGRLYEEDYGLPGAKDRLYIETNQPLIVYPGQEQNIEIQVKNGKGAPVAGIDLTAYGITSKFKAASAPKVPEIRKPGKERKIFNEFDKEKFSKYGQNTPLHYRFWNSFAHLDANEYYRFLYPADSIYTYAYVPEDSITQFAPFVSFDPIHIIQVDKRPVYFSWTTHEQTYSFPIDSGYHEIRLRTNDKVITIDSLYFPYGKKLIFSLQDSLELKNITYRDAEPMLSKAEQSAFYKYLFPYRTPQGASPAYLLQGDHFLSLQAEYRRANRRLAGPVYNRSTTFVQEEDYELTFQHEPGFEYEFQPKILKMRTIKQEQRYPKKLTGARKTDLKDLVLTREKVLQRWADVQQLALQKWEITNQRASTSYDNARLKVDFEKDVFARNRVLTHLLFKPEEMDFLQVVSKSNSMVRGLSSGEYRWMVFFEDQRYAIVDSLNVIGHGINYYKIDTLILQPADTFSTRILKAISSAAIGKQANETTINTIQKEYQENFAYDEDWEIIEGYITDEDGEALIGATILIKGTTIGTVTDINGFYSIRKPPGTGKLLVSYTGYSSYELDPTQEGSNAMLNADTQLLEEVVVTGLGIAKVKQDATASVETISGALLGKAAGVSIKGAKTNSLDGITIRGLASIDLQDNPLIVVDGVIFSGRFDELDSQKIKEISTLKGGQATAIYGARANGGVLIISTQSGSFRPKILGADNLPAFDPLEPDQAISSIRSNFRDYAYWQPSLRTDANGKASFEVTFPDDVTNWKTFVLAMGDKRQSAQITSNIKSYKPLMAQLSVPRFLILGDSTAVIGKTLNYTADSLQVKTAFSVNEEAQFETNRLLDQSIIDTLGLKATTLDTLAAKYLLEKENGYQDGEIREIPVFPQGLEIPDGQFLFLGSDTSFQVQALDPTQPVHIRAEASLLKTLEYEVKSLFTYKYLCNEQAASKLMAFILHKKIQDARQQAFGFTKDVNDLIRRLEKNRNKRGLWGWWGESNSVAWISTHVMKALLMAKEEGFSVKLDKLNSGVDKAIWQLEADSLQPQVMDLLERLLLFGEKVDYEQYLDRVEAENNLSFFEYLRVLDLRQQAGIAIESDTILTYRQTDIFGDVYFAAPAEERRNLWSPDRDRIQQTLLAIKVLQQDSSQLEAQSRAIAFVLKNRYSLNTYQRSRFLSIVLPALVEEGAPLENPSLSIQGVKEVTQFPFDTTLIGLSSLKITKQGKLPVYFTHDQDKWETRASKKEDIFVVKTNFSGEDDYLEAGESAQLILDLEVKKDASYVMLEVPIPAGCSYERKTRARYPEVHREYFKNYVAIFFRDLDIGHHTIRIDLMPRYSGRYHLNPAKAALMYFPVFYGNNELKVMEVR